MLESKPRIPVTRIDRGDNPDADGQFDNAPYFNFNDGKVKFNTNWVDNANDNYGSASAFLPKSLLNIKENTRQTGGYSLTAL